MDWVEACGSASGRQGLSERDRRQLTHLDAVRLGIADAGGQLAGLESEAGPWRVEWASGTDLDPRLKLKFHVGPVVADALAAVAWGMLRQRPLIAVSAREDGEGGSDPKYRLRVWDVLAGGSRVLPCPDPAVCLSFATMDEDPVLVSAHRGGRLRIWGVEDWSLRKTVDTGNDDIDDLYVAEFDRGALAVAGDARGRVRQWWVPTGEQAGVLETWVRSMCGGRLADGRPVLLTSGDDLSLWDLENARRLPLRVPPELGRVTVVALSTASGRDRMTVYDEMRSIITFDPVTGVQMARINAHVNGRPDGLMRMWRKSTAHPGLAVISGTLAVPTPWRVHLWDLATADQKSPPIAGPVAHCTVRTVRWQDRDLLLTASAYEGVVALWDLNRPVDRASGHEQRVIQIAVAEPSDVVVSTDEGGTVVARHSQSGHLMAPPLATGIECTRAFAAWFDGRDVLAATGAGSIYVPDGEVRCWNMSTGARSGPSIQANPTLVRWLSCVHVGGVHALVTLGSGTSLKTWRLADGALLGEVPVPPASVTGFAMTVIDGRPFVALSSRRQPMSLYALDSPAMPPITIPAAGDDVVLDVAGPHVVATHFDHERAAANAIRSWHVSGSQIGPDIRSAAGITAVAVRAWPAVYIGREDGTISLTDVETGRDLCPPMMLPSRPNALIVSSDGNLIVGFGSDLACVLPPVRTA